MKNICHCEINQFNKYKKFFEVEQSDFISIEMGFPVGFPMDFFARPKREIYFWSDFSQTQIQKFLKGRQEWQDRIDEKNLNKKRIESDKKQEEERAKQEMEKQKVFDASPFKVGEFIQNSSSKEIIKIDNISATDTAEGIFCRYHGDLYTKTRKKITPRQTTYFWQSGAVAFVPKKAKRGKK